MRRVDYGCIPTSWTRGRWANGSNRARRHWARCASSFQLYESGSDLSSSGAPSNGVPVQLQSGESCKDRSFFTPRSVGPRTSPFRSRRPGVALVPATPHSARRSRSHVTCATRRDWCPPRAAHWCAPRSGQPRVCGERSPERPPSHGRDQPSSSRAEASQPSSVPPTATPVQTTTPKSAMSQLYAEVKPPRTPLKPTPGLRTAPAAWSPPRCSRPDVAPPRSELKASVSICSPSNCNASDGHAFFSGNAVNAARGEAREAKVSARGGLPM